MILCLKNLGMIARYDATRRDIGTIHSCNNESLKTHH